MTPATCSRAEGPEALPSGRKGTWELGTTPLEGLGECWGGPARGAGAEGAGLPQATASPALCSWPPQQWGAGWSPSLQEGVFRAPARGMHEHSTFCFNPSLRSQLGSPGPRVVTLKCCCSFSLSQGSPESCGTVLGEPAAPSSLSAAPSPEPSIPHTLFSHLSSIQELFPGAHVHGRGK